LNSNLQKALAEQFPDYANLILVNHPISESTWNAPLKTGKALEFITLISLLDKLKSLGCNVIIPEIYQNNPHLYYLRNELPLHHNAQAGHSAQLTDDISLNDRFLTSCTPKAIISHDADTFYIMREGNPIHEFECALKSDFYYKERPDISIYSGSIDVLSKKNSMLVTSKNINSSACYDLSIKNTNILPIQDVQQKGDFHVTTLGVIECSINKSSDAADSQISKYNDIFENISLVDIEFLFVNGGANKSLYQTLNVNTDKLLNSFLSNSSFQIMSAFLKRILTQSK
jgi:hypothetical protein